MSARWWWKAARALLTRPDLWVVAVTQLFALARPGWWRRPPFLPLPSSSYLRFRLQTAYGDAREPEPEDLVNYLHWCKAWSQVSS